MKFSPPIHPGEVLREEFLVPLNLTAGALARRLGVPRTRIERVAGEQTPITPDTALRLARFFGTTANFWVNMQANYDLEVAAELAGKQIAEIEPLKRAS